MQKIKEAAQDVDAIPSNKHEAIWTILWQGVVISFMVFFLEYVIWAPIWDYIIIPTVERIR